MPQLKEEDIRPARLMADKQRLLDADRAFLLERRSRWVEIGCPGCGMDSFHVYGAKRGFQYVTCDDCGTVYTNPRPSLELLHEFYATSQNYAYWNAHVFPATEEARRERIFRPRAERLVERLSRLGAMTDTLLEVGAAFGTFCDEMRKQGLFRRIVAVEPTPDLAETCRSRGFEVFQQPIETIGEDALADVVAAFEVLEHLFSPRDFVQHCGRLLRPGGVLVLSCPNVRGFDVATLGLRSGTFDHEHLNYFHPRSLSRLVADCGFEVLECLTPGQLDADIVHKSVLSGEIDFAGQPLLREVFIDRWTDLAAPFQAFLSNNGLSSHMWLFARRTTIA